MILLAIGGSVVVIDLNDFSIPVAVSAHRVANMLRDITTSQYQDLLNNLTDLYSIEHSWVYILQHQQ